MKIKNLQIIILIFPLNHTPKLYFSLRSHSLEHLIKLFNCTTRSDERRETFDAEVARLSHTSIDQIEAKFDLNLIFFAINFF